MAVKFTYKQQENSHHFYLALEMKNKNLMIKANKGVLQRGNLLEVNHVASFKNPPPP